MQKIFSKVLIVAGVVGGLYSFYGFSSQGGDGMNQVVAFMFWGIFFLASLSFINLGFVLLRGKADGAYGAFSTVSALLLGAVSGVLLWFIFGPR